MGKWWKFICIILILCGTSGCKKQEKIASAVVTQVQIDCVHAGVQISRDYTDADSISAVLDCLRLQRRKGMAQVDPERIIGDVFEIRIHMSDGAQHIYRHRGGQYLSKDGGPWQIVSREHGAALYALLWEYS